MEPKKLKVVVIDKNTLRLEEDGNKGDFIDLRELTEIDTSSIEKAISTNTDKVYAKKLEEQAEVLESQHQKELSDLQHQLKETYSQKINELEKKEQENTYQYESRIQSLKQEKESALVSKENELKDTYSKQINELNQKLAIQDQKRESEVAQKEQEVEAKYIQQVTALNEQIKAFDKEREQQKKDADNEKTIALADLEKRKDAAYQSLQNQYEILKSSLDQRIQNQELKDKNLYDSQIQDLKNAMEKNKLLQEKETEEKLAKAKEEYSATLVTKDNEINELKRERSLRSVKVQGENLELWCNNEVLSYMQNGLKNCTWEKDNLVVKEEGENKGSKADFIFKVYSDETHSDETPLASVCMDMKSEDPNSTIKKKNADYFKQLDLNRKKKQCKYAVLVSELEMDNPNDIPIFKVEAYPDMYVVRPNYLMTFLNMIVSLTMRYAYLIQEKSKEEEQFKSRQQIEDDFAKIKNTYLDKPLLVLKNRLDEISKNNQNIQKANLAIETAVSDITTHYINQIEDKLSRFELALEKDVKKIEKIQ